MMKKFLTTVKKEYGVSEKALKDGVWFHIENTNVELLVKPATAHNIDFMKKQLEFDFEKSFGKDWQSRITVNPAIKNKLAQLYYPSVIIDYRYHDTQEKEVGEEIECSDIADLFGSAPAVFNDLAAFVLDYKNFQLIGEEEVKN